MKKKNLNNEMFTPPPPTHTHTHTHARTRTRTRTHARTHALTHKNRGLREFLSFKGIFTINLVKAGICQHSNISLET